VNLQHDHGDETEPCKNQKARASRAGDQLVTKHIGDRGCITYLACGHGQPGETLACVHLCNHGQFWV